MRGSTALNGSLGEEKTKLDKSTVCRNCGKSFPYRKGKLYCNTTCRVQYWYQKQSGIAQQILELERKVNDREERIGALEHPGK